MNYKILFLLIILLPITFNVSSTPENQWDYHTYESLREEILSMERQYGDIMKSEIIGTTYEGREILAIKISDNVHISENETKILIMGGHHAREWISVEVPFGIIKYLVGNYQMNNTIKKIVDDMEIWFIPLVNPDGHEYSMKVDKYWRKNRNQIDINNDSIIDGIGVDLNRNYGHRWGVEGVEMDIRNDTEGLYPGKTPFSENETRAIKKIVERERPAVSISYHSYGRFILYPWGNSIDFQESVNPEMKEIAEGMAVAIGNNYKPMPAKSMYPATGDTDDWLWANFSIFPFTVELGDEFAPPLESVDDIVEENIPGAIYAIKMAEEAKKWMKLDINILSEIPVPNGEWVNYTITLDTNKEIDGNVIVCNESWSVVTHNVSNTVNISILSPRYALPYETCHLLIVISGEYIWTTKEVRVYVARREEVIIYADEYNLNISPGEKKSVLLSISNLGNAADEVEFALNVPEGWNVTMDRRIYLEPFERKDVTIFISVPENEISTTYPFELIWRTPWMQSNFKTLRMNVSVSQIYKILIGIMGEEVVKGEEFEFWVKNIGNGMDKINVSYSIDGMKVNIENEREIGIYETVRYKILFRETGRYNLSIIVYSSSDEEHRFTKSINVISPYENFITPFLIIAFVFIALAILWMWRGGS